MKKTVSFLLLMVTIMSTNAQNNDSLLFSQITINAFSIVQTENSLTTLLGNPSSIDNYENEINKETWLDYKYSVNSFYFFENKMVSFDLKNSAFYFYNPSIKAGNNISEVSSFFPNSYSNREVIDNLGFIIIDINMQDGTASDTFVVINYSPTSNVISSIHLGSK
ncbi:hypothetical protein [Flavobacterium terrisoli]|uniref:hypothetical protein n=1 Tax=Flavobacterium terrisoli TaxID=3242195 RepID=UPI0025437CCB|nr:hypothetical protein [Flavobacterium buctense]